MVTVSRPSQQWSSKVSHHCQPHVYADDSLRPRIYLIFLLLTAVVLPVWWYTTSVPRATLSFPTWTSPRRLSRRTALRVFMVDVREEAWQDLGGPWD